MMFFPDLMLLLRLPWQVKAYPGISGCYAWTAEARHKSRGQ